MTATDADVVAGAYLQTAQERIVYGRPAGEAVAEESRRLGAQRVFLVSGRSLAALADGPLQQVAAALGARHAGTYAAVQAHSPREDVIAIAEAAREAGADLLVGIGGGSPIDAAKAALMCRWLDLRSIDAMEPYRTGLPADRAQAIVAPAGAIRMLSVTTTLSAPEFTSIAGVTDSRLPAKQSFNHRLLVPQVAVLDPAATLHTPADLLFSTAIRSVDHAVETWCSPLASPATEAQSLQGLTLLAQALPAMKASPGALAPRQQAQFGMWQAIAAFSAGVQTGASHGIGYALGAGYGVAHGHTSCVMLPAVLQWNEPANGARQAAMSRAMGRAGVPAHECVRDLIRALGQPSTLREVGIRREQLEEIAVKALAYPPVKANPRPIAGPEQVREILELAW